MIDPELSRKYLEYSSPYNMYKNLNNTIGLEENKAQVNAIKDRLTKLMEAIKRSPTRSRTRTKNTNTKRNAQYITNFFRSIKWRKLFRKS